MREVIVRLVFIIYWLLLTEGILRKWVLPQFQKELYFLRDPFILAVYYLALRYGYMPRRSLLLLSGAVLSVLALLLLPLQIADFRAGFDVMLAGVGWRNYFFLIPLAFIIWQTFEVDDLERLFRHTLIAAVPIALLMQWQVNLPAGHAVNAGFGAASGNEFRQLDFGGLVRASGTFTSGVGTNMFAASAAAMLIAVWILPPRRRPVRSVVLYAATPAVLLALGVAGSRGLLLHVAIIVCSGAFVGFLAPRDAVSIRALLLPVGIVAAFAVIWPLVVPQSFDAFKDRWIGAYEHESRLYAGGPLGRVLNDFTIFTTLMPDAPPAGYGLGFGSNAATRLGSATVHRLKLPFSEADWSRHIVDLGPVLGPAYILFRIALTIVILRGAVMASMRSANPIPLMLAGFVAIVVLNGQITGQGTANCYGWLFAGFALAAARTYGRTDGGAGSAPT